MLRFSGFCISLKWYYVLLTVKSLCSLALTNILQLLDYNPYWVVIVWSVSLHPCLWMPLSYPTMILSPAGVETCWQNSEWVYIYKKAKKFISLSIVRNRFIPFMGSLGFVLEPIPAVSGWGQGASWTSRQLIVGPFTDGRGCHGARCRLHIRSKLGFSILLKDTTTCSSAQPGGAGIWTSDPTTYRPALLAERQPPCLSLWT